MSFFGRTELDPNARLHVVIEDTGTILFQGEAYAISSTNELGPFDILPYHSLKSKPFPITHNDWIIHKVLFR